MLSTVITPLTITAYKEPAYSCQANYGALQTWLDQPSEIASTLGIEEIETFILCQNYHT